MKVEYFLNDTQDQLLHWEGLCVTHNKGKNLSDRWKKKLKEIRGSWIFKKVWLKAAKSVSEKWILLEFVRETRTKPPYLPSKNYFV